MKTTLTPNFTLEELCYSQTAAKYNISNVPTQQSICNLAAIAHHILQPLRDWWGKPIKIGSGYRCKTLNSHPDIKGVWNSQHVLGEAVDICIDGDLVKGRKWFEWIRDHCEYDQLIWEHNSKTGSWWIHVSYCANGKNSKEVINHLEKK